MFYMLTAWQVRVFDHIAAILAAFEKQPFVRVCVVCIFLVIVIVTVVVVVVVAVVVVIVLVCCFSVLSLLLS